VVRRPSVVELFPDLAAVGVRIWSAVSGVRVDVRNRIDRSPMQTFATPASKA
jgi:hypothetical protein